MINIKASLKTIVDFIVRQRRKEVRELMYKDFLHKMEKNNLSYSIKNGKENFDVAIFCIINKEFNALNSAFNFIPTNKNEYKNINGLKVWKSTISRKNQRSPLSLLFIMVGEAGNISCTRACMRLFDNFDIGFAILSGIAAGHPNETVKYSTIISKGVVDYEHQRLNTDSIEFRPDPIMIEDNIKRSISYLMEHTSNWKDEFKKMIELQELAIPEGIIDWDQITLKEGIIASGEKLFADNKTLVELADKVKIDKGIIAGEMEGSGFTHSCKEFKIPWLVFRGISDYGGIDKNEKSNKKYQNIAAISSAIALKIYLENEYRSDDDLSQF